MDKDQEKPKAAFTSDLVRCMGLWVNDGSNSKSFAIWVRGKVYGRKAWH